MSVAKSGALIFPMRTDEFVHLATESEWIQNILGVTKRCTERDSGRKEEQREDIVQNPDTWEELAVEPRETNLDAFVLLTVALRPILTIVARNHVFHRHPNVIRDVVQDLDGPDGRFTWLDGGVV